MGTVTVLSVIDAASTELMDPGKVRWTKPELIRWLNDGQREIARLRKDAVTEVRTLSLDEGVKQALPAETMVLVDVLQDGTGRFVSVIHPKIMDASMPTWRNADKSASVIHCIYDPRFPKDFYVYPPNSGSGTLDVVISVLPTDVEEGQAISVDDEFKNDLVTYVLYRAFRRDDDDTSANATSQSLYQTFTASLGIDLKSDVTVAPTGKEG